MQNIKIAVITDSKCASEAQDNPNFDIVIKKDEPFYGRYQMKVDWIPESPFEKTMYLDADTAAIHEMGDIFQVLDWFDLALPHASFRDPKSPLSDLSSSLFLFKNNTKVRDVFKNWKEKYQEAVLKNADVGDQIILTRCIYESTARLYVLPNEYHFNTGIPGVAHGPIRLVTAHKPRFIKMAREKFNSNLSHRSYVPLLSKMIVDNADQTRDGSPRESKEIDISV
jgi:hypothetical protein